jgi:hypothetical protein
MGRVIPPSGKYLKRGAGKSTRTINPLNVPTVSLFMSSAKEPNENPFLGSFHFTEPEGTRKPLNSNLNKTYRRLSFGFI